VGSDGRPGIYFFDTCTHLIRTLPALQHDLARPEDVDSEGEDHAPDECRYACMSRPYLRKDQPKQETTFTGIPIGNLPADPRIRAPTMDKLWKDHSRAIRGEPV
jgi:hypothetical protein